MYRWWHPRRDACKVLHLLAQTGPGHGAVEADAHIAGGGDDECKFRRRHCEMVGKN